MMNGILTRTHAGIIALVVALISGSPLPGAKPANDSLEMGLATVCITPKKPLWMQGYASRPRYQAFESVFDDIYAKALAVRDSDGRSAVLITVDLCVLRPAEEKLLTGHIMANTGLKRGQIMLNMSHTHAAPIFGPSDLSRNPMKDEDRRRTLAYTDRLGPLLAKAAKEALEDLRPASVSWGIGAGPDFIVNRRVYDKDGNYVKMGPNRKAWTDRRVHVLRISDPQGKVRGVLFGVACHPVTLGSRALKMSADFPGWAMKHVEETYPGAQAMFLQGCGADVNSHPRANDQQYEWIQRHGAALGKVVCRVLQGKLKPVRGPFHTEFHRVNLPLQSVPTREELEKRTKGRVQHSFNAKLMLKMLDRGETPPGQYRAPLAMWQFGKDLTLVGLSGEVVSDYIRLVERELGAERLWVSGYNNQVFGYLPSRRIVKEGGYEARGLVSSGVGWFASEAEDVLLQEVREMAERAGR